MKTDDTTLEIPMADILKEMRIKLKLTGVRRAVFRLKIALWLFRLAAFVSGAEIEIEEPK